MGILDLTNRNNIGTMPYSLKTPRSPEEEAYEAYLSKPTQIPAVIRGGDVYTAFKEGGFVPGVTKLADYLSTAEGQKILAGTSGNPYVGEAFMQQAGQQKQQELGEKNFARGQEAERMKSIGDLVTEREKALAEQRKTETAGEYGLKEKQMDIDATKPYKDLEIQLKLEELQKQKEALALQIQNAKTESERKDAQDQLDRMKFTEDQFKNELSARSWWQKITGSKPKRPMQGLAAGDGGVVAWNVKQR